MASSSAKHYNYFKEKRILQEEEKALKKMLSKFQDQLNRLKIEELALMSLMKMQASKEEPGTSAIEQVKHEGGEGRRTRSLDSISDVASTSSSIIPVGLMIEDVSRMNKEAVDLKVNSGAFQGDERMDDFEEEEEEEEDDEEEEEDETEEMVHMDAVEDYTRQLRSYMDNV